MPTTVSGVETDVVTLGTLHDLSAKESTLQIHALDRRKAHASRL
jgi:hypothetical protein